MFPKRHKISVCFHILQTHPPLSPCFPLTSAFHLAVQQRKMPVKCWTPFNQMKSQPSGWQWSYSSIFPGIQTSVICLGYSPSRRKGLTMPTCRSQEVSGTYPSIFSEGGAGSSTTVIVEPFQVSIMRRPLSEVTRVHCFLSRVREKLWISSVKDCMLRLTWTAPER